MKSNYTFINTINEPLWKKKNHHHHRRLSNLLPKLGLIHQIDSSILLSQLSKENVYRPQMDHLKKTTAASHLTYHVMKKNLFKTTVSKKVIVEEEEVPSKSGMNRFLSTAKMISSLFFPIALADESENIEKIMKDKVNPGVSPTQEKKLKRIFRRFASESKENGELGMTPEDFVRSIVAVQGSSTDISTKPDQAKSDLESNLSLLFHVVDKNRDGFIDWNEYKLLFSVLTTPEYEFKMAFELMDPQHTGTISRQQFVDAIEKLKIVGHNRLHYTTTHSEFLDRFFGKQGEESLSYPQFTHFLKCLREEIRRQEFYAFAKGKTFISADQFAKLITGYVSEENVPPLILSNIKSLEEEKEKVSFVEFEAINRILGNLLPLAKTCESAMQHQGNQQITITEFQRAARRSSGVYLSPLEVSILFKLFSSDRQLMQRDTLSYDDVETLISFLNDVNKQKQQRMDLWLDDRMTPTGTELSGTERTVQKLKKFGLKVIYGGIAGGIGALSVYPIDLVKTRMQNQRPGHKIYANSIDCFKQTYKHEGFLGFYRGVGPQMAGVAPEKAVKLVVNDFLRDLLHDPNQREGELPLHIEIISGCGAGASQVMVTNPLEIVKIRLQVAGEVARQTGKAPKGFMTICKDLGFGGLYKGAGACLMRDVPFSGIYFPLYVFLKQLMLSEGQTVNDPHHLLLAGSFAGAVAASSTTPFDVVKTRLQVETQPGQVPYRGLIDTFRRIFVEEGFSAFFKGVIPRVTRSSPQFGVTLLAYETLQSFFGKDEQTVQEGHMTGNVPLEEAELEALRKIYEHRLKKFSKIF
mmetsp:Transcript_10795/g.15808  ORF Transcript_10795/g.15808 Transcript_10795/m.15808 type:complete len:808 (-) Transcript_10795:13-2436(-)